ncbi:actin depolymerizing protein [Hesseltinella vesiculosa]|uniref:Twinfilin n=1 Tax=Hesseltinella vesiculosa TaxID=101127 RepID=A0A1X2G6W9_9FUNG|nr:actin depolymerizing protein [Hesseltinella vesiculosa]
MSHQSGIKVSEDLARTFADAVAQGNTRLLRVSIVHESLASTASMEVQGTFDQDFEKVVDYLEDKTPCFVLVRMDEKRSQEYQWLFLSYVPDDAKIRDKMIYASTRATLTKDLGDGKFADNMYGTQKSEFTKDGYKKHLAHKQADAPLTQRERELAEIKAAEAQTASDYQGTSERRTYTPGVAMPMTDEAKDALKALMQADRPHNYVSLFMNKEQIDLDQAKQVAVNDLKTAIPANDPRFTFYVFEHQKHGENKEALVFVYTCPSTSKIRDRMIYSSSKRSVLSVAALACNVEVAKKYETSDPSEVTADYLLEDLDLTPQIATSSAPLPSSPTPPSGSLIGDRIQMLGGTQGGFKRPVAPGRRRPATHV